MRAPEDPWYKEVTRYQWLVLLIASLGWMFDIFEGQIFVTTMKEAIPSLLPSGTSEGVLDRYNDIAFALFLGGGAVGGVFFGMLSDRIGRAKTMLITILVYSVFTTLTAFVTTPWQFLSLRFFVALGVGGEWAVASAMVAEVFPKFARVKSLGIFHATSTLGSYLAIAAGFFIVSNEALRNHAIEGLNWRLCFLIGALPALLTIWIRMRLKEPESWVKAQQRAESDPSQRTGRLRDLFSPQLRRKTATGVCLAAVGLATFWGVKVRSQELMRSAAEREIVAGAVSPTTVVEENFKILKRWEMTGLFLIMTGGMIGMLCFAPISERVGRRSAFLFYQIGGFLSGVLLFAFFDEQSIGFYWIALPVFGFLVSGMHAGFAVYFPELFPSRLRSTGAAFCFNGGRLLAVPALLLRGFMRDDLGWSLSRTSATLSCLFLLGAVVIIFAPETNNESLPE